MPFHLIKQSFVITFLSQVFKDNWSEVEREVIAPEDEHQITLSQLQYIRYSLILLPNIHSDSYITPFPLGGRTGDR